MGHASSVPANPARSTARRGQEFPGTLEACPTIAQLGVDSDSADRAESPTPWLGGLRLADRPECYGDTDVVDESLSAAGARPGPHGRGAGRRADRRSRLGVPAHAPRVRGQVAQRPAVLARAARPVLLRVPASGRRGRPGRSRPKPLPLGRRVPSSGWPSSAMRAVAGALLFHQLDAASFLLALVAACGRRRRRCRCSEAGRAGDRFPGLHGPAARMSWNGTSAQPLKTAATVSSTFLLQTLGQPAIQRREPDPDRRGASSGWSTRAAG